MLSLELHSVGNYLATPEEAEGYFSKFWKLIKSGTVNVKIYKEYPFSAEGVKASQIDIVGRGAFHPPWLPPPIYLKYLESALYGGIVLQDP